MNVTDEPQKHVKMPNEPLEIDEEDFYVRAFIKWAIEEQPELKRLETENAQLRELLWELFHCSRQVGCDCCEIIYRRNCGVLDRIRELGIEVD